MKKFLLVAFFNVVSHISASEQSLPNIAELSITERNDVQITETQQQTFFAGTGGITHRPIRLEVGNIIGHGEGRNALNPVARPILARVASYEGAVIAYHNEVIAAAAQYNTNQQ